MQKSSKSKKPQELKELKSNEKSKLREELLNKQFGKCDICKSKITEDSGASLDHQHKLKSETNGEDGAGLIRGVLCRSCNILEGKWWNNTQRYKQARTVQDRINLLEQLIEYYKSGTYPIIHPNEIPKDPKISKRNYNKLKKVYNKKAKFPEYPKSGKLTKSLKKLFEEFNISPFN